MRSREFQFKRHSGYEATRRRAPPLHTHMETNHGGIGAAVRHIYGMLHPVDELRVKSARSTTYNIPTTQRIASPATAATSPPERRDDAGTSSI